MQVHFGCRRVIVFHFEIQGRVHWRTLVFELKIVARAVLRHPGHSIQVLRTLPFVFLLGVRADCVDNPPLPQVASSYLLRLTCKIAAKPCTDHPDSTCSRFCGGRALWQQRPTNQRVFHFSTPPIVARRLRAGIVQSFWHFHASYPCRNVFGLVLWPAPIRARNPVLLLSVSSSPRSRSH